MARRDVALGARRLHGRRPVRRNATPRGITGRRMGEAAAAGSAGAVERDRCPNRDRAILQVADVVRAKRTEVAWQRLSSA
jgi:hypothetical protein